MGCYGQQIGFSRFNVNLVRNRDRHPFCVTKDFDQSYHSCLNFFSLRVSGRSSFLPILSHYLPYLNISDGETKPGCEGAPPSLMSVPWMMVFQGCEKYWRKIATDIQLSQHAATGERFLPVILLPVSSLSFRLPGRSCIFLPILTCESFFAYGKGLQNLAMITKFNTKYNTIFYINVCGVF